MPYRSSEDTDYVVFRDRKARRYRPELDDDDEDDDDYQSEVVSIEEARRYARPRAKYYANDDIDYDYRPQRIVEPAERIRVRKGRDRQRVFYDDYADDHQTMKILRNRRSPSPVEPRRAKYHSSDRRPIYYERDDGRVVSRPPKKNVLHTRKTQVVYPDDEPTKIMKRVIIDPRTGHRETIYERDRGRKHQKYIVEEQPADIVVDSEDDEENYFPHHHHHHSNYLRTKKHRPVLLSKYDSPKKYIKIRQTDHSEPTYAVTSKLPAIKSHRRILYEIPGRKVLSNYHY